MPPVFYFKNCDYTWQKLEQAAQSATCLGGMAVAIWAASTRERWKAMSSTDAEKTRLVLDVFAHFGTDVGEPLAFGNLLSIAAMNAWETTDIADGYKHGVSLGWFRNGPNGTVMITEEGFAQIG